MKSLNLNSLRVFSSAARHGSFLNAATELNLSQGAVSQRIKQLEAELGLLLFMREARGVTLTKAGRELAQTVEACLDMLQKTASKIKDYGNEITLHVSPTIARKLLSPRLPTFSKSNPNVCLSIEACARVLERPLRQNEIALRHGKTFRPVPGQQMRPLAELELVAVCSPDLPGIDACSDMAQLLASPLIQDTHRRWDRLIELYGSSKTLEPLQFNSASLAIDAAINKQGIAIIPLLFVQDDLDAGRLVEVWRDRDPSGEYIFLVWPQQREEFSSLMDVVRWLNDSFDQHATSAAFSHGTGLQEPMQKQ